MIRFEPFYRNHGVYRREELTTPRTDTTASVELPIGPVIHYVPEDPGQFGPDETYWLLRKAPAEVWVDHVTDLSMEHGKPRVKPGDVNTAIRVWHRRHRGLHRVLTLKPAVAAAQSTLVINYGPLNLRYQYPNGMFTEYHRAMNLRDTLWREIVGKLSQISDRHHWVPIQVPTTYPNLRQIQKAEVEMDRDSIRRFSALNRLLFLDVWRWLGDRREQSIIAAIPETDLARLNLVFVLRDRWFVMNLGHVNAFRKQSLPNEEVFKTLSKEEQQTAKDRAAAPYEPLVMQKRFLRGMMALVEAGMLVEMTPDAAGPDVKKPQGEQNQSNLNPHSREQDEAIDFSDLSRPKKISPAASSLSDGQDAYTAVTDLPSSDDPKHRTLKDPTTQAASKQLQSSLAEASLEAEKAVVEISDEQLDKDLDSLTEVDALQQEAEFQAVVNPNADPMTAAILSRADALAKDELISGPQYKALQKLAEQYKTIKNPYGPGLLHEATVVTPEELVVKPKRLGAKGQIFDESMLHTSLTEVTSQYVKHTLRKDVVNAVLSAQKAGVAVTDYRVVTKVTAVGAEEIHSVRLNPVGGVPSTWNFVVPVVKEDGTFMAAGTNYRAKWQRRDVPIRKIAAGRVTLTSQYGKVAVNLSERQVNNYARWLAEGIAALGIEENGQVKDVVRANVFFANTVAPKIYTLLSRRIKTMTLVVEGTELPLNFDYVDRQTLFTVPELQTFEADHTKVVVGKLKDGRAVVIDADQNFTLVGKGGVQVLGQIEDILKINRNKAPVEIAMVKVMGQEIPMGVVLAYYYGLGNLLRHANIEVRRVLAGDQMKLADHELPIRFSDETLIIDTRNPTATLLLAGFRHYKDLIRQSSVYAFDRKSAYVSLLDGGARSAKYTSELDLLDELWVDPVTEGMLKEMGEPTTWRALLVRAMELLKTDYSPSEVDGAFMVYKGYDRLSGTIYREMVGGIRQFRHKNRISKAAIDIKPTAVWNAFTDDASIAIVNDVNPINELRELAGVTYIGNGGRSKRSMVAKTRRFHVNDIGTISESTVDSGDTGINIYLSANPQIVSTRGFAKPAIPKETGTSSMVSAWALLSPCADKDDQQTYYLAS